MRKILISNPSSMYITFLPYLHGVLKLHAEADPEIARNYQWLKPLYLHETPEFLRFYGSTVLLTRWWKFIQSSKIS